MKKILIFSTAYYPFIGGAEVAIKEITDRIDDFEFDMITARMDKKLPKNEKIGNINVYRIGIGWAKFDKYWLAWQGHKLARKLNKKNKYSLTWAMMASFGGFAAMFFKQKNNGIPFLLTLQEGDEIDYINKRVRFLKNKFKKIFTNSDHVQCISEYLADWARQMGAESDISVIPNGVDLNKFRVKNVESRVDNLKEELGFKKEDRIIIHAGRYVKKNGLSSIIKALKYLPDNVKFFSMGDGDAKEADQELVKELNLENRVVFSGRYDNDELPKHLQMSDIFCRPSLSEGQGISFLEAMATGIPVIATSVGGIVDFLKDKETGISCEVNNPESIARGVKLLLEGEELKQQIIKKARALIEEKYDWDKITPEINNIFKQLSHG